MQIHPKNTQQKFEVMCFVLPTIPTSELIKNNVTEYHIVT